MYLFLPLDQVYNEEVKDLIGATNSTPAQGPGTPVRRDGTRSRACGTPPRCGEPPGGSRGLQLRETPEGEITVLDLSQHEVRYGKSPCTGRVVCYLKKFALSASVRCT